MQPAVSTQALILVFLLLNPVALVVLGFGELGVTQASNEFLAEASCPIANKHGVIDRGMIQLGIAQVVRVRLCVVLECKSTTSSVPRLSSLRVYLAHGEVFVELVDILSEIVDLIRDVVSKLLLFASSLNTAILRAECCLTAQFLLDLLNVREIVKTLALGGRHLLGHDLLLDQDFIWYLLVNFGWCWRARDCLVSLRHIDSLVKKELTWIHLVLPRATRICWHQDISDVYLFVVLKHLKHLLSVLKLMTQFLCPDEVRLHD